MATKVICDRCGKDVEGSDTQLIFQITRLIGKANVIYKERDFCRDCCGLVIVEICEILDEEIKPDF